MNNNREQSVAIEDDADKNIHWTRWLCSLLLLIVVGSGAFALWYFNQSEPRSYIAMGTDANGGEPYVIKRDDGGYTGFEVEIARYFAEKIGKEFRVVHKSWETLPQELSRKEIDVVFNGYEWSEDREKAMLSTIPYYAYRLQLVIRKDSPIRGWDSLKSLKNGTDRWKVAVLTQSAAHDYVLRDEFKDTVEILALSNESSTPALTQVKEGNFDATVQDVPMVSWFLKKQKQFPQLVGLETTVKATQHSWYVIYVRKKDTKLQEQLNRAIVSALRDGTLERIYKKYDLYDEASFDDLKRIADQWEKDHTTWPPEFVRSETGALDYAWILLQASGMTVLLACLAMPLAIIIGLLVAIGRVYGPRWLGGILEAYVEILRGTPLLLQLFVIFYALPSAGITFAPFQAALLGLALNYSAYEAEIYRAGLLSIPKGQMEAALSLGMSKRTAIRRIIVPQAFRTVIPPVTNDFIALFKDTSVCSVIAVVELTERFRGLMIKHPQNLVVICTLTALLYLVMSYPLARIARRLERKPHQLAA